MTRSHLPGRPHWRCRACGAHWPCQPAKLALLREYAGHTLALIFYLVITMREAEEDMIKLGFTPDLAAMNVRFVRWISHPLRQSGGGEAE